MQVEDKTIAVPADQLDDFIAVARSHGPGTLAFTSPETYENGTLLLTGPIKSEFAAALRSEKTLQADLAARGISKVSADVLMTAMDVSTSSRAEIEAKLRLTRKAEVLEPVRPEIEDQKLDPPGKGTVGKKEL